MHNRFRSKEISWLSFNERVLQEGANQDVPLLERIKFLGIYSSNLDEFFRVRVATLKRLAILGDRYKELNIPNPVESLKQINATVARENNSFNKAYTQAISDLASNNIHVIDNRKVPAKHQAWLQDYFKDTVAPRLMPIMLKASAKLPQLKDNPMYLAVRLSKKKGNGRPAHALIEIPGDLPRFVVLPKSGKSTLIMYLDDIIRYGIPEIFLHLPYDDFDSFAIKFTRDSELEFDDNFTESVYDKVSGGLLAREGGFPVRSNYDATIPPHFLRLLSKKLHILGTDSLYPGARYHNRKDLIDFPQLGRNDLLYPSPPKILPKGLKRIVKVGFFSALRKKDLLLHIPYHSFHTFIDFLRESSMDPLVQTIQITQYRLAKNSFVARALMAAAHNGKEVTVMVEPQARFDEGANIAWANEYQRNGVRVILGLQGLKVHSKLCLVTRREHGRLRHYTALGTGNFNELSAKVFSDHLLLTANQEMGEDAVAIFDFFERTYKPPKLKHLVAAPFRMRDFIKKRIQIEITNAREGLPAALSLKVNNLSDLETIELLYEAANAGVSVRLIVRGMFSLITGPDSPAPSIQAIGIVDKYLEHSRVFIFQNGNNPLVYLSSADLLPRNFDGRIETVFPILDSKLRKQLVDVFEIQWSDNVKARILSKTLSNRLRRPKADEAEVRAQFVTEDYLRSLA